MISYRAALSLASLLFALSLPLFAEDQPLVWGASAGYGPSFGVNTGLHLSVGKVFDQKFVTQAHLGVSTSFTGYSGLGVGLDESMMLSDLFLATLGVDDYYIVGSGQPRQSGSLFSVSPGIGLNLLGFSQGPPRDSLTLIFSLPWIVTAGNLSDIGSLNVGNDFDNVFPGGLGAVKLGVELRFDRM